MIVWGLEVNVVLECGFEHVDLGEVESLLLPHLRHYVDMFISQAGISLVFRGIS